MITSLGLTGLDHQSWRFLSFRCYTRRSHFTAKWHDTAGTSQTQTISFSVETSEKSFWSRSKAVSKRLYLCFVVDLMCWLVSRSLIGVKLYHRDRANDVDVNDDINASLWCFIYTVDRLLDPSNIDWLTFLSHFLNPHLSLTLLNFLTLSHRVRDIFSLSLTYTLISLVSLRDVAALSLSFSLFRL